MNADHSHIFWLCPKIQTFWGHVSTTMVKILGYPIPNNVMVLYFCVLNENVVIKKDWYLCKILLMACKKVITKCWYKTEAPSTNQWMDKVKEMCLMEKMTFSLRSRGNGRNGLLLSKQLRTLCADKWRHWTLYIGLSTEEPPCSRLCFCFIFLSVYCQLVFS